MRNATAALHYHLSTEQGSNIASTVSSPTLIAMGCSQCVSLLRWDLSCSLFFANFCELLQDLLLVRQYR